ncbi:hypothetical protein [Candidatus Williamhamiltonella defendens]|nr:hypothetical protein [Candidatus Hamiltonella defensa]
MQNLTQIYSSPCSKPIIFQNDVKINFVQELKNINNENNSEIPDFSKIKASLNSIIGGKYQIEKDTNLTINPDDFGFNEEDGDGYIKFTLSKSDTGNDKETSTTGLVYFEKKQGNEVEYHLAIDDKHSLNKKSSLIDFFKNIFKKIFGDKTKVDLISTKKELIAQKIENFLTKKDMQGEIQKEKQNLIECTKKFKQKEKKIKSLEKTLCEEKLTFDNEESVFKTSIEKLEKHNNELQEVINQYEALTNEEDNSRVLELIENQEKLICSQNRKIYKLKKELNALQQEKRGYAAPLNKLQNQIVGAQIKAETIKKSMQKHLTKLEEAKKV